MAVSVTLTTQPATNVADTSFTANGRLELFFLGGGSISYKRRGFCYKAGSSGEPTVSDSVAYEDGSWTYTSDATINYSRNITGLTPYQSYRVAAYMVRSADLITYADAITVIASAGGTISISATALAAPESLSGALAINNLALSAPALSAASSLAAGSVNLFNIALIAEPLIDLGALSAAPGIDDFNLSAAVLNADLELSGAPAMTYLLAVPALSSAGVLNAAPAIEGLIIIVPEWSVSGAVEGAHIATGVPAAALRLDYATDPAGVYASPGPPQRHYYLARLQTPATTLIVPMESFQGVMRAAEPDYLGVSVPGVSMLQAIRGAIDSGACELSVWMVKVFGAVEVEDLVLAVDLVPAGLSLQNAPSEQRMTLSGYRQRTPNPKTSALRKTAYVATQADRRGSRVSYHCHPDIYLRPGDTVLPDIGGSAVAASVTWQVSPASEKMIVEAE